jgi:NAD(P)H-flavin reductase
VRLVSNRKATPTTRIVRIAIGDQPFVYRAGQAAWVGVDASDADLTPYSIASAPEETAANGWLEFLVKVDGSSRFGARVTGLRSGTTLAVRGPAGAFTFPEAPPERRFLFVAGGTGIAPVRSMIRHAIDAKVPGTIALVYSARTPAEFAYAAELRGLARHGALELELTLTGTPHDRWRYGRGRAGTVQLARLIHAPDTLCFVCGPPSMVTDVAQALQSLGVPTDQIRTEGW